MTWKRTLLPVAQDLLYIGTRDRIIIHGTNGVTLDLWGKTSLQVLLGATDANIEGLICNMGIIGR